MSLLWRSSSHSREDRLREWPCGVVATSLLRAFTLLTLQEILRSTRSWVTVVLLRDRWCGFDTQQQVVCYPGPCLKGWMVHAGIS